jgi:glucose-6-phosphate isomerase
MLHRKMPFALRIFDTGRVRAGEALDDFVSKLQIGAQMHSQNRPGAGKKMQATLLSEPGVCHVNLATGQLDGATGRYVKTFGDLEGLYEDASAFEALLAREGRDALAYEVTDFKPSTKAGDMIIGVTRMRPGRVGKEFFLTRGHIHARGNRPEMYYGESGSGLMLLESPEGEIRTIEIGPKTMCYVPPFWIHRSINVGAQDLVMTFAYPADSGQDYAIIEEAGGMRSRIVADAAGAWVAVENASYRGRSAARIAQVYASAS